MLRGDGLRRIADRLHLFQAVIEAIEAVGGADSAAPAALCEGFHTHGGERG